MYARPCIKNIAALYPEIDREFYIGRRVSTKKLSAPGVSSSIVPSSHHKSIEAFALCYEQLPGTSEISRDNMTMRKILH